MRVLFVASECAPFAKVGGLGDVVGALPKALHALGVDVRVLLPRYGSIPTEGCTRFDVGMAVPIGDSEAWCGLYETRLPGSEVPVYLLEHDALFGGPHVYRGHGGDLHGLARFALLSRSAFSLGRYLDWIPDVIHAHDWPTAPAAVMLATVEGGPPFAETASVLSIHNIAHQPRFPAAGIDVLQVGWDEFRPESLEDHGALNLFKGGLHHATMLSTVSVGYAEEIQAPTGGAGLDPVIRGRAEDLVGIVNGIDDAVWDPAADPHIPAAFSAQDISCKQACKVALQREVGLAVEPETPLLGVVSRLAHQKGIDLIEACMDSILATGAQLVILGTGDPTLEDQLRARSERGGGRIRAIIDFSEGLAHRIEAGADLFLMPSRFEPCGLNQLYSQRYGTLPVVRATGGLKDTVRAHDPPQPEDTGFSFEDCTPSALLAATLRAIDVYRTRPELFRSMQRAAMSKDLGWARAARAYLDLYERAARRRRSLARADAIQGTLAPACPAEPSGA